jgi:hypothetical protein
LVEANRKSFKKMFPHLTKELTDGENTVSIDSVRANAEEAEKSQTDKFHDYVPTVVDFLRRCSTEKEANEIIAYLEERREITKEHAQELRKQLTQKGVRSFGPKKQEDYYFKESEFCGR